MGCNTSKEAVEAGAAAVAAGEEKLQGELTNLQDQVEEIIDIDPNDPEAQKAAAKIQAVFRGHKTRKEMKSGDAQEETQNFEEEFRPDDKELCHAATKIQASFRGHQARRQMNKPEDEELSKEMEKLDPKVQQEAEELDIDLTDPELHKAATKIQASFRGHKVRKPEDEKEEEKPSSQ
ncbi:neuromodulin [Nilaparvata lugens]|uniref:neuromodulin n=1 Tax=Nilaparvata lugens TaxID=108931 RepID=UPI00193CEA37|nr:neuromodulin [Nilaparvata lugens]